MTKFFEKFRKVGIFALILGLLWQTTSLSTVLNIGHAKAAFEVTETVSTVVINEFVSDPSSGKSEWVEIYNPSMSAIDISGWYVEDSIGNSFAAPMSIETSLKAGSYAIFENATASSILNNSGDTIYLYDSEDNLVDQVTYGGDSDVSAPSEDKSAGLIPNGTGSWTADLTPTLGAMNYKDVEDPTATVTLNNSEYDSTTFPKPLVGTARDDVQVTKVEVNIKDSTDNKFWNGSTWIDESDTWNDTTLALNTSAGASSHTDYDWSYTFDPTNFTSEHSYDIKARATDIEDKQSTPNDSTKTFTYKEDITKPTSTPGTFESYYNASTYPGNVFGTAEDKESGLDKVEVKVKNSKGKFWNNGSKSWQDSAIWNQATGLDNWTLDLAKENFDQASDKITVYSKATDKAGLTQETMGESSFTYDATSPTGAIMINDGTKVTTSNKVDLNFATNDENPDKMKVYGDFKNSSEDWQDYTKQLKDQELTDGEGFKLIQVQYKDKAGNLSEVYGNKIYYNTKASYIDSTEISGTAGYTNGNIHLEYMTSKDRILTYAEYSSNPEGNTAFSAFGKYFDLSMDSNEGVSNLVLYIYYTQADLDAAGITENQITGLYYWNDTTSGWELYPNQEVVTTNVDGYEGYIRVELDHLTPMVMGADNEAPAIPAEFKAEAKDSAVKLTWNKINDADHYDVRYRKSTDDNDEVPYSEIYIINDTKTEISNLENGVEYEFNIRAVDSADNKGEWAVVVATPNLSDEEIARRAELAKQVAYYGSVASSTTDGSSQASDNESEDGEETEIVTEGEVKSEDDVEGETEGARTAVTLGIIIIAIGAALGGYYGYQWWLGEGEIEEEVTTEEPKEVKKPKSKKKKKSNRRW